jgi:hypothetical protein
MHSINFNVLVYVTDCISNVKQSADAKQLCAQFQQNIQHQSNSWLFVLAICGKNY